MHPCVCGHKGSAKLQRELQLKQLDKGCSFSTAAPGKQASRASCSSWTFIVLYCKNARLLEVVIHLIALVCGCCFNAKQQTPDHLITTHPNELQLILSTLPVVRPRTRNKHIRTTNPCPKTPHTEKPHPHTPTHLSRWLCWSD